MPLSIQETKLKAIADSIRTKNGTLDTIQASDYATAISAIQTGSDYAQPLFVTVDTEANIVAKQGELLVSAPTDAEGNATLILPNSGTWEVIASKEGKEDKETTVDALDGYSLKFNMLSRLPDGYTELEYISNPNLGYISDFGMPNDLKTVIFECDVDIGEASNGGFGGIRVWKKYTVSGGYYTYYMQGSWLQINRDSTNQIILYSNNYYNYTKTNLTPTETYYTINIGQDTRAHITVDWSGRYFDVNGTRVESITIPAIPSSDLKFAFFTFRQDYVLLTSSGFNYPTASKLKCYNVKVKSVSNGETIIDLVPAKSEDEEVGLIDIVSNNFYPSSTSKKFLAGPEV